MEKELETYLAYLRKTFKLEIEVSKVLESIPSIIKSIKKNSKVEIDNDVFSKLLTVSVGKQTNIEDYADIDIKKIFTSNTKKTLFGLLRVDYKKVKEDISNAIVNETNHRINSLSKSFKETGIKIPSYIRNTVSEIEGEFDEALFNEFECKAEQCNTISDLIAVCDSVKQKIFMTNITKKVDRLSDSLDDIENRLSDVENKLNTL